MLGSCQFWELGSLPPGIVSEDREGCLQALGCLGPDSCRVVVARAAGTHCGVRGWEHSRGAFQSLLSNAWLWYSSRAPLSTPDLGALRLCPPRPPHLERSWNQASEPWVPGSPASSMRPPRGALDKVGLRRHLAVVFPRWWRHRHPLFTDFSPQRHLLPSLKIPQATSPSLPFCTGDLISSLWTLTPKPPPGQWGSYLPS